MYEIYYTHNQDHTEKAFETKSLEEARDWIETKHKMEKRKRPDDEFELQVTDGILVIKAFDGVHVWKIKEGIA